MEHYLIIIERGENNYSAYSPDISGCIATGETIEQTIKQMKDAIYFHIEGLEEYGEAIPKPQPFDQHINQIDVKSGDLFAFVSVEEKAIAA